MSDDRPRVIAIYGPTATGKTAVAEAVADQIPAEVVSADAMQLYQGLPILTNQPKRPTHLVGIWSLDHQASVAEYQTLAHIAIDDALADGKTPVVVGGTGLYLRSALAELEIPPQVAPGVRSRLETMYEQLGPENTHALLVRRDPHAAAHIHPNDRRRVVRALELNELGASLRRPENRLWTDETRYPTRVFGLVLPPEQLAARIEARTRAMFEQGVAEEVRQALAGEISSTARQTIGLAEVAEHPPAQAAAAIVRRTQTLASYQRKWMRRIPGLIALDAERSAHDLAAQIIEHVRPRGRARRGAPPEPTT